MNYPCINCKGHQLTFGRCHGVDRRKKYQQFRENLDRAKKDVQKSAKDAIAAKRYSG